MTDIQRTQTVLPQPPSLRCPKTCQTQEQAKQHLKAKAAGTENEMSFKEYTRYMPVYTWYIPNTRTWQSGWIRRHPPGPLAFYSGQALCLGSSLTYPRIPVIFCRDAHIITFLILWISSICHVSRMTKGNEASRAASQAKKEKETTKKKERETRNRFLR